MAKTPRRKSKTAARRPARPTYTELRSALEACAGHIDHLAEIDQRIERMAAAKAERPPRERKNHGGG